MKLNELFQKLWKQYTEQNPDVLRVYELFTAEGETVVNDHIAFRTFNDKRIGIDVLAKPFLRLGYVPKGEYRFENKHLFARHYELPEDPTAPRIFISELLLEEFSEDLQQTVRTFLDSVPPESFASDNLIFAGRIWGEASFEIYEKLRSESEYAAWLYLNGFRANHFTVSVNHLKKYDSIEKVNTFLKAHGFIINDAGGEIQGNPSELLEQSSIKAGLVEFELKEGKKLLPGCYYEFARRYTDENGQLYSGFIAKSADKIFQSTDFYQK